MAGGEITRLPIDKQRKCPPAAAAAEPGANYGVMIALLSWTSQATVEVMSLQPPTPTTGSPLPFLLLSTFVLSFSSSSLARFVQEELNSTIFLFYYQPLIPLSAAQTAFILKEQQERKCIWMSRN